MYRIMTIVNNVVYLNVAEKVDLKSSCARKKIFVTDDIC